MENGVLTLHTTLTPEALSEKLRLWEPLGHRIDFDNGVSTKDFKRRIPFFRTPIEQVRPGMAVLKTKTDLIRFSDFPLEETTVSC
jgi:hypothetical protein